MFTITRIAQGSTLSSFLQAYFFYAVFCGKGCPVEISFINSGSNSKYTSSGIAFKASIVLLKKLRAESRFPACSVWIVLINALSFLL